MRRLLYCLALLFAPATLAALPATALRGHVTSGGKPVAGATITLTSKSLQQPRTTTTTRTGTYWIEALPPGDYDVTFSSPGLLTLTRRVVIELAHVARADAVLEPSEDEESITSTMKTVGVADTTAITTHRTTEDLALFPIHPDTYSLLYAVPGSTSLAPGVLQVDGTAPRIIDYVPAEALDEMTSVRAAQTQDLAETTGSMIFVRTRSGGEQLSASLRDTLTSFDWVNFDFPVELDDEVVHLLEGAAGGSIVPERLWFFGAAHTGKRRDVLDHNGKGVLLKLTGALNASHSLSGSYELLDIVGSQSTLSLWHIGQWSSQFTSEAAASHTNDAHSLYARASYVTGAHVIRGGIEEKRFPLAGDVRYAFVNDRWTRDRLTMLFSLGYESNEGESTGQVAAAYDLRGDGRHALLGSISRYAESDEATIGFASAIGSSGSWRVDAIHRDREGRLTINALQVDLSYRLFDRLGIGGNYTWSDFDSPFILGPRHEAHAWLTIIAPVFDDHAVSTTFVQHYEEFEARRSHYPTDVALRYTLPVGTTALTLGGDIMNIFNSTRGAGNRRTLRFYVRIAL